MLVSPRLIATGVALAGTLLLGACSSGGTTGQQPTAAPLGLGQTPTTTATPTANPTTLPNPNFSMTITKPQGLAADHSEFHWMFDKAAKSAAWCQYIDTTNSGQRAHLRRPCQPKFSEFLETAGDYRFALVYGPRTICTPTGSNGYECARPHLQDPSTPVPAGMTEYFVDYRDGKLSATSP